MAGGLRLSPFHSWLKSRVHQSLFDRARTVLPEDLEVLAAFEAAAAVGFFTYDLYDPVAARTIADALEQAGRELRAESNDGTPEADAYDDLLQTFQDWRNGVIRDEHP